ncbi:LysR family transcriptional regulator [Ligilactobacillus acidipiscis]|uniref:Transcriptional regulator n=1 Tax=Ligilactobacillus acidipiscis TaxID=89059 RepID=A0A0R2JU10_9LACO|nr:LysR family transcriptional regulator [Ligilactobacillus acidipiscis]KRN80576.1 transcriptional regulator [Ligilactobacillus acidipiscis]
MPAKDPALTLQYLDTLLRYSNFTKAAQQLYISQPYLTQLVKRKERELNVELINRHSAHLQLTEAGKLYYQYLEKINQEKVDFHQKLTQYNNNNKVTIKVGILPSMGSFILPLFVPNFMQDYPNVTLTLDEGLPSISEKKVQNGEINFCVGQSPETVSPKLKTITTGHEQYFILIPRSSKFYDERFKLIDPQKTGARHLDNKNTFTLICNICLIKERRSVP